MISKRNSRSTLLLRTHYMNRLEKRLRRSTSILLKRCNKAQMRQNLKIQEALVERRMEGLKSRRQKQDAKLEIARSAKA